MRGYLINLATTEPALRARSIEAMADEIDRAEALGLLGVVLHPGCYTRGSEAEGLELIAGALVELFRARRRGKTMVLLEHTAGQGTALGATFEQLASIIAGMNDHPRAGVCLDTCHLLASGYDLCTPEGYADTFEQFGRLVGFDRLKVFHLNDSKKPLGSRLDRHEHIGQGHLGLEAFRRIVNDRRFRDLPMLLETPKEEDRPKGPLEVDRFDERNLATLRGLIGSDRPRGSGRAGGSGGGRVGGKRFPTDLPYRPTKTRPASQTLPPQTPELRALFQASRGDRLCTRLRQKRLASGAARRTCGKAIAVPACSTTGRGGRPRCRRDRRRLKRTITDSSRSRDGNSDVHWRKRGSVLEAATAQRAIPRPSGSSASMCRYPPDAAAATASRTPRPGRPAASHTSSPVRTRR
jgi:deoxyribonuclease-4